MLVKLYDKEFTSKKEFLATKGITIKRASIVDKKEILQFVEENFEAKCWVDETEYALFNNPISCLIAVKNKEIIGFACYDVAAKGFFGPTGVKENHRGQGIGEELLIRTLNSLKEAGYAYAIIGWSGANAFYEKTVNAIVIEDSEPNKSVFRNLISHE